MSAQSSVDPRAGNTGVDSATVSGYLPVEVKRAGQPSDYYYRLALDTLQVSIKGEWKGRSMVKRLLEHRRDAESRQALGFKGKHIKDHNGRSLVVYPMGARPSYQVLMRGPGGLEVRLIAKTDMPPVMIRFGARWCIQLTLDQIREWVINFAEHVGLEVSEVNLSEVHVRCDVPTPFPNLSTDLLRGTCTRGATLTEHKGAKGLETLHNQGGKKPFKFVIYDKRAEQAVRERALWPTVWASSGIPADSPIWRVEGKWKREALQDRGLFRLSDLSERTIAGLWHHFTTEKLIVISNPSDKRTSRLEPHPQWKKIQACGQLMVTPKLNAKLRVDGTQLMKQAGGCVAGVLAEIGMGNYEQEVDEMIERAVLDGLERFDAELKTYLLRATEAMLCRFLEHEHHPEMLVNEIREVVLAALDKRIIEEPYA